MLSTLSRLARPLTLALLAPTLVAAAAVVQQLRVQPDRACVVANHLAGAWVADADLTTRLGARPQFQRLEFKVDEAVLESVPAELTKPLAEMRIFQAGTLSATESNGGVSSFPYVLVSFQGNAHVVCFRAAHGGGLDDGESMLITAVPGKQREQDLLFAGGDFDNEPFKAFKRETPQR